ncbi:TonB-dependent receptor [Chitinophaga horti]|uniref:TonB-dependent receptor n=1 Tax=Chitinophaga horti TaxID=2920382 RepID=A0ABY6J7R0_9BACT|nr:TonB-dependent receptor [Chitinophaga horti]UYQ94337.1 TonB-dependent receptor [Chitinophaga horti]
MQLTFKKLLACMALPLTMLCHSASAQQKIEVKGVVTDSTGGVPEVNIAVMGQTTRFTTDAQGRFSLTANRDATLQFSMIGFVSRVVRLSTQKPDAAGNYFLDIRLLPDQKDLNEVTIVGFGTQKKASMVSAVATVNVKDLKGPTGNLTNTLAGKVPGLISFQRSGEPGLGTDNSNFFIRGLSTFGTGKQDPLILIDGVESSPTDMARLQPDDISDFSLLKDAAASAVYGARGANGVVLINTKQGQLGTVKFNVRGENRISSNTRNFKFADNITYMELANEATAVRSPQAILPYSQNKINHTKAGDDPVLYPNNNWLEKLIKPNTVNQGYNMNLSGGTGKARYYVAGTFNRDNGVLKVDKVNDFNSNIKLLNYSLRTNVNLNVTNTTELVFRMYGQFDDYQGPIGGGAQTFRNALTSNPVAFPALYPSELLPYVEHPLFGSAPMVSNGALTTTLFRNPYAEMVKGYRMYKSSNLQPQFELKQDLKFITPGLRLDVMTYVRRDSYFEVDRSYNPFFYNAVINPQDQTYHIKVLNDGSATSIGTVGSEFLGYGEGAKTLSSRVWLQSALNYNRDFGKHSVGGMLITYLSSFQRGNDGGVTKSLPQRNNGVSGRFTYGYDDRYMAELNFGYNGSERFAANNRYGFFPSAGVAYRVVNEAYFQPLRKVVTDMKLRATYGIAGNDAIGNQDDRFFYLSSVTMNDAAYAANFGKNEGQGTYGRPGVSVLRYANPNITWELSRQLNLGMDLKLFEDFELIVDVYKQWRSKILMNKAFTESASGLMATPMSNYGKLESKGIDLSAQYRKSFNKNLWATARGTFTYAVNERTLVDELLFDPSVAYLSARGHSVSQTWGLVAERLFVDTKEVANSPVQFGDVGLLAGDIKYKDINKDGMVNNDDLVPIGYPTQPEIIYGFGGSAGYKNFDFSFYFQGSARSSLFIDAAAIQPFFRDSNTPGTETGLLKVIADNHWSPENPNLYSFWPRLSTWRVGPNNQTSTWWMRNGNFLRLKSVDAGYTFPTMKKAGIDMARIYFSATNLFILSNFKLWDVEMGGNGLGYPLQSVYSMGVQVNF